MCDCCDVLRPALERLLKDASWFTKERCSKYGEPYGNGTDAEHEARQALEATKDATTERDALKAEVQRLREVGEAARTALTKLRTLVAAQADLQGREHVQLGIEVNNALAQLTAALRVP